MTERRAEWYCGAPNPKRGKTCRNRAGARTDHLGAGMCWVHGGRMPTVSEHAQRDLQVQRRNEAARKFGMTLAEDPEQVILANVAEAAGLVEFYRARVQELLEHEAEGTRSAWHTAFGTERGSGLFGPKIELDRFGAEHTVGEDFRGMVKAYNSERDRLVKYAKTAIDAGIAKKQVEQAQRFGDQMVVMLMNVFSRLGLAAEVQAQARQLLATEFRLLAQQERIVEGSAK